MTLTCANQGGPCTVGVGACAATGTIVCNPTPTCTAVAGMPNPGWHTAAAANGSWDWNCDGVVWYQYPSGDSTAPPANLGVGDGDYCASVASATVCTADHWFNAHSTIWPNPCGHLLDDTICNWVSGTKGPYCDDVVTQETTTEGCQ